ncbi:NADPH-dependent FMN reductase [uncultured Devosia sp.]|uniref:NADPH-dependent FMN reductase n=1 Tax=uncultured Devosia sp. TaxID=211434 RepID=UPI0035C9543F
MKIVAVLLGSLSRKSINASLAKALEKLAAPALAFDYLDIASLPHYNNDLWDNPPEAVTRFKAQVSAADAVLIVMPEINRSFPAVIKNALDWGSRPWGQSSWLGKPVSLVGMTPGTSGTAPGQGHLRTILPLFDLIVMGQPEVYLNFKPGLIDDHFEITDDTTRGFLEGYLAKFAAFIDHHGARDLAIAAAAE